MNEIAISKYLDQKIDTVISKILDKYLYNQSEFKFERVYDRERQVQGIDVILSSEQYNLLDALIDEKAATSRLDGNLNTFILELLFKDRAGNDQVGWFIKKSETTHYLFVWLTSTVSTKKQLNEDNVSSIEVMLVPKQSLIDYFKSEGFSDRSLLGKAILTRDKAAYFRELNDRLNKPYHISCSRNLPECPVNLVVDKELYKKLAVFHKVINR